MLQLPGKYWVTGKIIYDYWNGEEKILEENDVMGILELFKNNSLRDEQLDHKRMRKRIIRIYIRWLKEIHNDVVWRKLV